MVFHKLLRKTSHWARAVGHFGHLGKVAATRSFLLRERKKLFLKLGEKAFPFLNEKKLDSPELTRLVNQIDKINALLSEKDYGGRGGVDFKPEGPAKKRKK